MPHAQSPHCPAARDSHWALDVGPPPESPICTVLPFRPHSPLPSQSSTTLPGDAPSLAATADESAPITTSPSLQTRMNFDEQQRGSRPVPTGFGFSPAAQSRDAYQAASGFSSAPDNGFQCPQHGMSYENNYKLTCPAQYSVSTCPRSYNAFNLNGLPHDLSVTDLFPPNAYHTEPPKHHDAMNPSDREIKSQLMQLSNDYDHPQYTCPIKVEDYNHYQSPYSDPAQGSAPRDETLRHIRDPDAREAGIFDREQPYAQLIYRALLNAPNHTMILRDIYDWFRKNTDRASSSETKGWQNSIRHNLSMNGAFEKVNQPSDEARRGFMWRLTEQAIREGVKSTTRYRSKQPNKRGYRTHQPQPQRQASGAKGGQAARRAARLKQSARMHEAYLSAQPMSRSVPAAFDPSCHRYGFPCSVPPSPYTGSETDFGYTSQNSEFPDSPLPDGCNMDLFSSASSYMGSPMSQGISITDTAYWLHQSPSDSLFTNSSSPANDGPRTPLDQGVWQEDIATGPSCMFDNQLVYRENSG